MKILRNQEKNTSRILLITNQIDNHKMVQRFLPKQELDKIFNHSEESVKSHTFTSHHKRNPSRLFNQPLFQGHIPSTE